MSARQVALPVAVAACLAGAFSVLQSFAPVFLGRPVGIGISTIVFAGTVLTFVLNPGLVLGIAYWASSGADVPTEWSAFAGWTFVAAIAGYLAGGGLGLVAVTSFGDLSLTGNLRLYYNVAFTALFGGIRATLAGVAGASVGHFQRA